MTCLTFPDADADAAHRWMKGEVISAAGWTDGWMDG